MTSRLDLPGYPDLSCVETDRGVAVLAVLFGYTETLQSGDICVFDFTAEVSN